MSTLTYVAQLEKPPEWAYKCESDMLRKLALVGVVLAVGLKGLPYLALEQWPPAGIAHQPPSVPSGTTPCISSTQGRWF